MNLLDFFRINRKPATASEAKQRLTTLLVLEQNGETPDFLPLLQHELLQVIGKYVKLDEDKVAVNVGRGAGYSTLEVAVELPPTPHDAERAARRRGLGGPAASIS